MSPWWHFFLFSISHRRCVQVETLPSQECEMPSGCVKAPRQIISQTQSRQLPVKHEQLGASEGLAHTADYPGMLRGKGC